MSDWLENDLKQTVAVVIEPVHQGVSYLAVLTYVIVLLSSAYKTGFYWNAT